MARTIKVSFYDKDYTIEFDRSSVRYVLEHTKEDGMQQAIVLIKGGLLKHHKNELPSDDDIFGWIMAMGKEMTEFASALQEMVQEVLKAFEDDRKNFKWAKVN